MHTDKDGFDWGDRDDPVGIVILYTNKTIMAFTPNGAQIPYYQMAWDIDKIRELSKKGQNFQIAKWRQWVHEITREEFKKLCGLD